MERYPFQHDVVSSEASYDDTDTEITAEESSTDDEDTQSHIILSNN